MLKKMFIILIALAMVIPVFAVDWEIYGHTYFKAWIVLPNDKNDKTSSEHNPVEQSYVDYGGDGGLLGVKMKYDFYEGRIEAGYKTAPDAGFFLRQAWLRWDAIGTFYFTVGQTWTPMTVFPNNMRSADNWTMLNCGLFYTGSQPQLIFGFENFSAALIMPFVNQSEEENVEINLSVFNDYYTHSTIGTRLFKLPKVEASYKYITDLWNVSAGIGVQLYKLKMNDLELFASLGDTIVDTIRFDDVNVTSAVFNADFGINLEVFYANIAVSGGFNYGAYGGKSTTNINSVYQITKRSDNFEGQFIDEIAYGGVLTAGLKINEFIKPEFGIGVVSSTRVTSSKIARYYDENIDRDLEEQSDLALRAYIQLNIMAPIEIITFTPEIGYADEMRGNQGQDEMRTIFGGCYITADF